LSKSTLSTSRSGIKLKIKVKKSEKTDHKKILDVVNKIKKGEKVNISSMDIMGNTSLTESAMSSVRSSMISEDYASIAGNNILGLLNEKIEEDKVMIEARTEN
jgi:hypothetical protein